VRRVEVTERDDRVAIANADYTDAFELDTADGDERSAEQWARDALEGLPGMLTWLIVFGWRFVLGFKLGPRASPDHVLGWRVLPGSPEATVLEARSGLLTAHLVFRVEHSRVVWVTAVHHQRSLSRLVWTPVAVLHRRIFPYALAHAAGRPPARRAP
jgi:Protein of unknown function (DUF2867)